MKKRTRLTNYELDKINSEIRKEFEINAQKYINFKSIKESYRFFEQENPTIDLTFNRYYQFLNNNNIIVSLTEKNNSFYQLYNGVESSVTCNDKIDDNLKDVVSFDNYIEEKKEMQLMSAEITNETTNEINQEVGGRKNNFGNLSNSKLSKLRSLKGNINSNITHNNKSSNSNDKDEIFELKVYDPKDEVINLEHFKPLLSNKKIDELISDNYGVMPGTTTVVIGSPGTGKTTLSLSLLNDIQNNNADLECMSFTSEMKKIDIDAEIIKKPWMRNVKQIILSQHDKNDYILVLKEVILYGYDFLVIDSFQNIVERLKTFCGMTGTEASNMLMGLFEEANEGRTKTGKNTAIFLIQQVTKGGDFAGRNSLKHDTTAMLELVYDKETNDRYCFYSKNRRCGNNQFKELYYYMDSETKEIEFDVEKFEGERLQEEVIEREKDVMKENKKFFDDHILTRGEKTLFTFLGKENEIEQNKIEYSNDEDITVEEVGDE